MVVGEGGVEHARDDACHHRALVQPRRAAVSTHALPAHTDGPHRRVGVAALAHVERGARVQPQVGVPPLQCECDERAW